MNETIITDGLGSVRTEAAPRRTITAYKLMRLVDGKLYPLYIDNSAAVELGVWYNADSPDFEILKTLPSGYCYLIDSNNRVIERTTRLLNDNQTKVRTSADVVAEIEAATAKQQRWIWIEKTNSAQRRFSGENRRYWNLGINGSGTPNHYSMRPGWHAGSLPTMLQVWCGSQNDKKTKDNFVFTECEISADIDYNAEAQRNPDKDLPDKMPVDGYYLKATNADKRAAQADRVGWFVAGAIKINRIISDSEAHAIIDRYNAQHPDDEPVQYQWPRESGKMFAADTMSLEGCLNGTNDFYALFSDDNDLLVDFGVGWNRRDVRRKAVEYMKEHNIQSAFIEITDCEGEIKDTIDIDLGLQGTKKAGTNPAEPIQVPTLEFIILENTKKMTPTEGIAYGNRHSLNGYPNDDANVIKKQNAINNIIDLLQNWHLYQIDAFNFKIFIAESLGVDTRFIYDDSTYRVFVFESDDSLKIRNSNHSATVSKFNERGEVANRNISIVIRNMKFKQTRNKKYINDNPTINAVEYVYFSNKTDNARLKLIAQAILQLLQTGEWNKNIAPADAQNPPADQSTELSGTTQPGQLSLFGADIRNLRPVHWTVKKGLGNIKPAPNSNYWQSDEANNSRVKGFEYIKAHQDIRPTKDTTEFNPDTYTSRDEPRPAMCGIYHDGINEVGVVCNGHILVASRKLYDADQKNNTIATHDFKSAIDNVQIKVGDEINKKTNSYQTVLSNWKSVLPGNRLNAACDYSTMADMLTTMLANTRRYWQSEIKPHSKTKFVDYLDITIVYLRLPNGVVKTFSLKLLKDFAVAAKFIGADEIQYCADSLKSDRAIVAASNDGYVLVMPRNQEMTDESAMINHFEHDIFDDFPCAGVIDLQGDEPQTDTLESKLAILKKYFAEKQRAERNANPDRERGYIKYSVRINPYPPEIGKSPIHAYQYPTGMSYSDVRFELTTPGSRGSDYLRVAFQFDETKEVRIECDALPEYKELIEKLKAEQPKKETPKEPAPEQPTAAEPTPGELTEAEKEKLRSYQGKGGSKDTTERGILDEYYTPDYVCEFMYRLAVKYGYTAGKVLEPSCATGNCIRPIYERNDYTHIDAFEINQTSRDICKKLYPDVNLYENYFETAFLEPPRYTIKAKKTWLPGAPYDLVIGNPPYGKHVNRYSAYFSGKDRFAQVEMFFMCKCLELLRSGGLLVFITSTNFMSTGSAYQQTKDRIGEMAELVDAYRLPKVFTNTDICTDIIVLRKK